MKFMSFCIVLFVPVLAWGAASTTQNSGTTSTSCDVDVWSSYQWTSSLLDLKLALVRELNDPAHVILNVSPGELQRYLTVQFEPGQSQGMVDGPVELHLTVALDSEARPAAKEFLDAVVAVLPHVVAELQNGGQELQQLMEQRDVLQRQMEDSSDELRTKQLHLSMDGLGGTMDGVREEASKIYEQREAARMETAAAAAEQKALAEQIEDMTKQAEAKANNDAIANELETIVKMKEKRVAVFKQEAAVATISPDQLDDAEAQAAEARVQFLERREAVAQAAGGDILADLRKQLVTLKVNLAEIQARSQIMADDATRIRDAVQAADDVAAEQSQVDRRAKEIDEFESQIDALRQGTHNYPAPVVRVVPGTQPTAP